MPARLRIAVSPLAVLLLGALALVPVGACANQSEGEPCSPASSDCNDGLVCTSVAGDNNGYRCCPMMGVTPSTVICTQSNPGVNNSNPDAAAGTSDGEAGTAPGEASAQETSLGAPDAPSSETSSPASDAASQSSSSEAAAEAAPADGARAPPGPLEEPPAPRGGPA